MGSQYQVSHTSFLGKLKARTAWLWGFGKPTWVLSPDIYVAKFLRFTLGSYSIFWWCWGLTLGLLNAKHKLCCTAVQSTLLTAFREDHPVSTTSGDRRSGICLILCWHLIHVINLVSLQDFFLGALQTLEPEDSPWFLSPAGARNGLNFVN